MSKIIAHIAGARFLFPASEGFLNQNRVGFNCRNPGPVKCVIFLQTVVRKTFAAGVPLRIQCIPIPWKSIMLNCPKSSRALALVMYFWMIKLMQTMMQECQARARLL